MAATKSCAVPPFLSTAKHFTAAIRSSIRDDATKPDVGRAGAQEAGGVDQEPAAAAVLEVGVQHRLARRGGRLHDLIPAVELVDDVAVDAAGLVRVHDRLGLLRHRWPST